MQCHTSPSHRVWDKTISQYAFIVVNLYCPSSLHIRHNGRFCVLIKIFNQTIIKEEGTYGKFSRTEVEDHIIFHKPLLSRSPYSPKKHTCEARRSPLRRSSMPHFFQRMKKSILPFFVPNSGNDTRLFCIRNKRHRIPSEIDLRGLIEQKVPS